jgi:hypothetical protein
VNGTGQYISQYNSAGRREHLRIRREVRDEKKGPSFRLDVKLKVAQEGIGVDSTMQEIGGPLALKPRRWVKVRAASSRLQEQGARHDSRDQLASWENRLIDFPQRCGSPCIGQRNDSWWWSCGGCVGCKRESPGTVRMKARRLDTSTFFKGMVTSRR